MSTTTRTWRHFTGGFALAVSMLLAVPAAWAAPCAGFVDVDDQNPNQAGFCPSVEWVKNRAVTTGCPIANSYCPDNVVTRLSMAAFMKRLGDALTPLQRGNDLQPGFVNLDANPAVVVCQTAELAVTNVNDFPRTAYADASVSAMATADVSFAADLVASTDDGANWTALNANPNRGSVPANQWGSLSDIGTLNINVGQTVRFGVRLTRGGVAGATNLGDSRCQIRVLIYSRTGDASPF